MPFNIWGDFVPVEPSGCQYCGIGKRTHRQRWIGEVGWHSWAEPTKQQRYERIRMNYTDRRKDRDRER